METTIYLCGPINGRSDRDCKDWRNDAKRMWGGLFLDPMRRDYRGKEANSAAEIVAGDIEDIDNSDVILAYVDKPSVGTSMEIFYAKHVKEKVVVVINAMDGPLSPWLVHHADYVADDLVLAINWIRNRVGG